MSFRCHWNIERNFPVWVTPEKIGEHGYYEDQYSTLRKRLESKTATPEDLTEILLSVMDYIEAYERE